MSIARHMAVMRNAPFLRALNDEALKLLAFASQPAALKPKQTLFEVGDPADGAVLVLGGQLRLIEGMGFTAPRVAGVGQLVDELALLIETERKSTAIAQTSCETLSLPRTQMRKILEEYPEVAMRLQKTVAQRAGSFLRELAAFSPPPAR